MYYPNRYHLVLEDLEARTLLSICSFQDVAGISVAQAAPPGESIYGPGFPTGLEIADRSVIRFEQARAANLPGRPVDPVVTQQPVTLPPALSSIGPAGNVDLAPINQGGVVPAAVVELMLGIDEGIARLGEPKEPNGSLPPQLNQVGAHPDTHPVVGSANLVHATAAPPPIGSGKEAIGNVDHRSMAFDAHFEAAFIELATQASSSDNPNALLTHRAEEPAPRDDAPEPTALGLQQSIEDAWEPVVLIALMLASCEQPTRRSSDDGAVAGTASI